MGIRYFASSGEIKSASICSEQISVDKKNNSLNKNANRILLMVALVSPSPECTLPDFGSLMQAILFCQLDVVIAILKNLLNAPIESQPAIVCEQIEGNRNIFHVAVQNAYSRTNADHADVDATDSRLSTASQKLTLLRRKLLRHAPTTRAKAHQQQQLFSPETGKDEPESAVSSDLINKRIPLAAKERQAKSIEIIRELCKNSVVREYSIDLMRQRDINGHSPFETAIYQRAYSAAQLMCQTAIDVKDWSQDVVDILMPSVGADDTNEDSSLFILCAKDTCSYTWTGEEHTPQKIYECKTCGLVGTLCCCTECALLCHRNHDCKLKKTSPTAYCDCWEKCECKALVTGNNTKREQLLSGMLQCPALFDGLNSKGEHILLFLARTLIEQEGYTKRSKRPGPTTTTTAYGVPIPEHDLEPPKFARKALDLAIGNWDVVKSLLDVGIKKPNTH
uniref:UBR-type domain-containing protein n=1 Tax=Meloidogyne incognita TaxID=6306 RepID=A0A914KXE7_MELIC